MDFNDEINLWLKLLERQLVFLQRLGKDAENLEDYYRGLQCAQNLRGSGASPLALVRNAAISAEIRQSHMQQTFVESNRVLEAVSDILMM